jgi:Glyoxalase superfamily protein/Clp amino terminal domain, pathogenicity island component
MQHMRDFRDAKAMARTLRAALVAKGHKITISESLELTAQALGAADWNTLSAAIREEADGPRDNVPPPQLPTAESGPAPPFSGELLSTLHRAAAYANRRKHQYTTLEHLLLSLTDDVDASAVMNACKVDLGALKEHLTSYIDSDLKKLVIDDGSAPRPTAGFQRAVQRAVINAHGRGVLRWTGAELLVGIFPERESPAARLLGQQGMTRDDAINFIIHGVVKTGGDTAA